MKLTPSICFLVLGGFFIPLPGQIHAAGDAEVSRLLSQIKAVGPEGAGSVEASQAWRKLVGRGPAVLMDTLTALDDANPTAANWLRSAVDTIAETQLSARRTLPADNLEAFVRDARHAGKARRLAYEWLKRVDKTAPDRLLPGFLNDPGAELRRDAVDRAIKEAEHLSDKDTKKSAYEKIFEAARDRDQVDAVAKEVKALGGKADINSHYAFINRWMLVGPFDNTGGIGFNKIYPPEVRVDPASSYQGKKNAIIKWVDHTTADTYGIVDLNKVLGKNMGAVAYAFAVVNSDEARPVEIRTGTNNAIKVFVNGEHIYFREEYHHGMMMDQYIAPATLKAGRNEILIKICQNEQMETWAQLWSFQTRICDKLGGAITGVTRAEQFRAVAR